VFVQPEGGVPPKGQDHPAQVLSPQTDPASPTESGDIRVLIQILQPGSASRRARAVVREVLQQAHLDDDAIADAEIIVAELAANAEKHARQPYELRIFSLDNIPAWCEVVDGDPAP
jgi:hypothetical protein